MEETSKKKSYGLKGRDGIKVKRQHWDGVRHTMYTKLHALLAVSCLCIDISSGSYVYNLAG